jgi:hypothetical protein
MVGLLADANNPKRTTTENVNTKTNHMNKLLLAFVFLAGFARTQTTIEFDNMETSSTTYLTAGWWTPAATAGWYTNASVSPNTAAAIYGLGNGSSALEQDWYSMPLVSGLDPNKTYKLRFRVASYTFSSSTATTRGLDVADYMSVQVSSNGGAYVTEMRITGNTNATWPFTNIGTVAHDANGSFTNSAAPAGDIYMANAGASTATASMYTITFPQGLTSIAVDFYCRINSAGEEWWLDNIELIRIDPLPVEMMSFEGIKTDHGNLLQWKTASEWNSAYYLIERSTTGYFTENSVIGQTGAAGYSNTIMEYAYLNSEFAPVINYYQITQVDNDGAFKVYGPIMIDNRVVKKQVVQLLNLMGQPVQENTTNLMRGLYIEVYDDGTMKKVYK